MSQEKKNGLTFHWILIVKKRDPYFMVFMKKKSPHIWVGFTSSPIKSINPQATIWALSFSLLQTWSQDVVQHCRQGNLPQEDMERRSNSTSFDLAFSAKTWRPFNGAPEIGVIEKQKTKMMRLGRTYHIYIWYVNIYIWSPPQDLPMSFFNGIYRIKCFFCKSKKWFVFWFSF